MPQISSGMTRFARAENNVVPQPRFWWKTPLRDREIVPAAVSHMFKSQSRIVQASTVTCLIRELAKVTWVGDLPLELYH